MNFFSPLGVGKLRNDLAAGAERFLKIGHTLSRPLPKSLHHSIEVWLHQAPALRAAPLPTSSGAGIAGGSGNGGASVGGGGGSVATGAGGSG